MKCFYDFHIHSALSPCADDDMTPADIVNMAALKGLDAIAISDHNSVKNCRSAISYAKKINKTVVIPAMELCTAEEIHLLCLFKDIENAEEFENYIYKDKLKIANREDIFGKQQIYDENNNIKGYEKFLLSVATAVPSYKAAEILKSFEGVAIPAHINRQANGIINILGGIDKSFGFASLELCGDDSAEQYGGDYIIIRNSDAHTLGAISEAGNCIEVEKITPAAIIGYLSGNRT